MSTQRKIILAGNWKMHKTVKESIELAQCVEEKLSKLPITVLLFPPFTAIYAVSKSLKGRIGIGGQNMYYEKEGAFTGEISPLMLKEAGAEYVIIGHSERRNIFNEKDQLLNKKVHSAIENALNVVLCVGEKLEERKSNRTKEVIEREIKEDLQGIKKQDLEKIIIAYEPIWAIGTGITAKPEEVAEVHRFIRTLLDDMFGKGAGSNMTILYGGSIKPNNIKSLADMNEIDGGLVGGASLQCESFYTIGKILSEVKA